VATSNLITVLDAELSAHSGLQGLTMKDFSGIGFDEHVVHPVVQSIQSTAEKEQGNTFHVWPLHSPL
jgi:hypothetical protein